MRTRIYELKYYADFNVRYWGIVENQMERLNNVIKISLAIGGVLSVISLIGGMGTGVWICAIISAVCSLVATAVIPVIGWDQQLSKINETRKRWIDVERMVDRYWNEFEATENLQKSLMDELDEVVADIAKISFWIKERSYIKERVELDLKTYYP